MNDSPQPKTQPPQHAAKPVWRGSPTPPQAATAGLPPFERPAVTAGDSVRDQSQREVRDRSQREPGPSPNPSVELNIEQLVLLGFSARDRYRIAEALQLELTRLLAANGVPASLRDNTSLSQLDAGDIRLATHARPETLGTQIAQSVYRRISQ